MKYILTEDQYEKLLNATRELHKNKVSRDVKVGSFNFNGEVITYNTMIRQDGSVYIYYNYKGRHMLYMTNEMKYIVLSNEEQKNLIENKIKNHIQKKLGN
jgi:hypothetical protein